MVCSGTRLKICRTKNEGKNIPRQLHYLSMFVYHANSSYFGVVFKFRRLFLGFISKPLIVASNAARTRSIQSRQTIFSSALGCSCLLGGHFLICSFSVLSGNMFLFRFQGFYIKLKFTYIVDYVAMRIRRSRLYV